MKNEIFLYFLLIGVLVSPLRATSDPAPTEPTPEPVARESSTGTTIIDNAPDGNSTRKDGDVSQPEVNVTRKFQSPAENESSVLKPQKIRKKILIANLKNATDKGFLAGDKYDKQGHGRAQGNGNAEEDGKMRPLVAAEDGPGNATEGRRARLEDTGGETGDSTKNDTYELEEEERSGPGEGRSFGGADVRRKSSANFKFFNRKNKVTTSTTENYGSKHTTSSYMYFTLGEVQKGVNNNYLNVNEDLEKNPQTRITTSNTPSLGTTAVLPMGSPESISDGSPVKNLVRLENGYFGPTDQTDWIPIVPVKGPGSEKYLSTYATLPQSGQTGSSTPPTATTTVRPPMYPLLKPITPFTIRRRPVTTEVAPVTSERATPTESVPATTAGNSIPAVDLSEEPSRSNLEFLRVNRTTAGQAPVRKIQNDGQRLNKFRGSVRYRPTVANSSSVESNETLRLNATWVSNVTGEGLQKLEIPPTGAWDVDAVRAFSSVRISTTETPAVNKTDYAAKRVVSNGTAPEEGVASPRPVGESVTAPQVVRPKNIAKVQVLKNTISDKVASDNPMSIFKFSETEPPSNTSKPFETSTSMSSAKPAPTTEASEDATPLASTKAPEENATTTVGVTESSTRASPASDSPNSRHTTTTDSSRGLPEGNLQTQYTASREILKTSTISPKSVANVTQNKDPDMTTTKDDPYTTEEAATVAPAAAETEREALYTTEEAVQETTFRSGTENEMETSTEVPAGAGADDAPIQARQPVTQNATASSTTAGYDTKPVTERENDVDIPDVEETSAAANATKTHSRHEDGHHEYHPSFHPNLHHEITEENVPAYLKLTVEAASWEELCRLKDDLRNAIIRMLDGTNVTAESIVFLNLNERNCQQKIEETKDDPPSSMPVYLPVNMFIMNENGDFDKNLSEAFLNVWGQYGLDFELPIRKVDFLSPLGGLYEIPNDSVGVSVIAAIVISCVAGLCVILLGILFVVMKRRQKRFNYGQRCTPVSLDAYSLDSVSIHNSVRRKGIRASKRSYGNAAFDDPEVPSHSMNFAGLANFSSDKEQLYEEFNIIPQVYPKTDELPAGAETKNRYANVIPLPETRVHLSVKDGDCLSDYINANYIRGLKGAEKLYIACQAPMESTVEDFWRMIWEQQCKVIIMLTDLKENGVEKCYDYLPPNEVTDNLRLFGDYQVTMKKRDVKEKYIISHLKLKNMEANLWREVTHLWYLGWPDQGVPPEANSLIAFLIEARSQMKSQTGSAVQGPAVVHCSPGTGRTGTVIACDLCIREFEQTRMVDIPKCVFNLRKDRAGSVQTKDQYAFIYQVLNVYATKLTGGGLESI